MGRFKKKKELIARRETLFHTIQEDPALCDALEHALQINNYSAFAAQIWAKYGKDLLGNQKPWDLVNDILSWAGTEAAKPTLSPRFLQILKIRSSKNLKTRTTKQRIIENAGLNPISFDIDALYNSIPRHECSPLAEPFPPPNLFISEDKTIYKRNMKFVLRRVLPDHRKPRRLIYELDDPTLLSHDIGPSDSAIFYDNKKIVAVVIRNACKHAGVVKYLDNTVEKVAKTRNNVRVRIEIIELQISTHN